MCKISKPVNMLAIAAMVAAVSTFAMAGAASAGTPRDRCASAGSRTLAANEHARVFVKRRVVSACGYRTGRTRRLGRQVSAQCSGLEGCEGTTQVVLAGRYVAYDAFASDRNGATSALIVFDVVRRRQSVRWISPEPTPQQPVRTTITDLVLTSRAELAWIATSSNRAQPPGEATQVMADTDGTDRVLDEGPSVDAGSLALSANARVYWTNAGQPRSTSLRDG
jgi:hypothetical protein